MQYRFYPLARGDRIAGPAELHELAGDVEAAGLAASLAERYGAVEIWAGSRLVGRVRLDPADPRRARLETCADGQG
jgi:hypothetical protein